MRIWRCPLCEDGVRAPARMRRDNALRYCLKCTARTGKLVPRGCPSAEAEKDRQAEVRKKAEEKARDRAAARQQAYAQTERGRLEAKCAEWARLAAFNGMPVPQFQVRIAGPRTYSTTSIREVDWAGVITWTEGTKVTQRQSHSTGRAYYRSHRFVVTAGTDYADALATILHELAHLAAKKEDRGHGTAWRETFALAVREVTGLLPTGTDKFKFHDSARECVRIWLAPTLPGDESGCNPQPQGLGWVLP